MVSPNITPSLKQRIFESIPEAFKQYNQSTFTFLQEAATEMDLTERRLTIKMEESGEQLVLPYHTLIIATGSRTPISATSLHGLHTILETALKQMQDNIAKHPKGMIIEVGGPVAVESAGEIGAFHNDEAGWFLPRPSHPTTKITVITRLTSSYISSGRL